MKVTVNLTLNTGDSASVEAEGSAALQEVNAALSYFDSIGVLRGGRNVGAQTGGVSDSTDQADTDTAKAETPKEVVADKPKTPRRPKAEAAAPAEPDADEGKPAAAEKAEKAPKVKLEEVTAAITELANTIGLQEARAVLAQFDVKRAAELKPEQYADFIAAAKAASSAAPDAGDVGDVL